MGFLIN